MLLIYEVPDEAPECYDLDELDAMESEDIERVTDLDWDEVESELKGQKPGVLRAALWVIRKRTDPDLRFADFKVPAWRKRLKVRLTTDEVAEHVETICRQMPDEDSPERAYLLRLLRRVALVEADVDAALAPAPKGAAAAPASAAKGRSRSSGPATSGTSPTT